jgi:hypothetical protein
MVYKSHTIICQNHKLIKLFTMLIHDQSYLSDREAFVNRCCRVMSRDKHLMLLGSMLGWTLSLIAKRREAGSCEYSLQIG